MVAHCSVGFEKGILNAHLRTLLKQEILDLYNEGRNSQVEVLRKAIEEEKKIEYMLTARKDIVEVMRVRSYCTKVLRLVHR